MNKNKYLLKYQQVCFVELRLLSGRHFEFQKNEEVLSNSESNKIINLELSSFFLVQKGKNIFPQPVLNEIVSSFDEHFFLNK